MGQEGLKMKSHHQSRDDIKHAMSGEKGSHPCKLNNQKAMAKGNASCSSLNEFNNYIFIVKCIALGVSFLSITLAVVSLNLVLKNSVSASQKTGRNNHSNDNQRCFTRGSKLNEYGGKITFHRNEDLICQKISSLFDLLIKVNPKSQKNYTSKTGTHAPVSVSAHVILHKPLSTAVDKRQEDHIITSMTASTTESGVSPGHFRGVTINTDSVTILFSGLYYVYSGAEYNLNTSKTQTDGQKQTTWFHYVHRIGPNNPMNTGVLLRLVYKRCQQCHDSPKTEFTGGIFQLEAGDQIKVCLSGQGFVNYDPVSSYFGLFLLASKDV